MKRIRVCIIFALVIILYSTPVLHSNSTFVTTATGQSDTNIYEDRKALYEAMSQISSIPWYYLAGIDQYERSLNTAQRKTRPQRDGLIAIYIPSEQWVGQTNPQLDDDKPETIQFFGGIGLDGDGDGRADQENDIDLLYTITQQILKYGTDEEQIRIALWEYYQNERSVTRITQFANIYQHFGTLDLFDKAFPLPVRADYSYRSTWGAGRSFGGYRIHEGTDLFARYGVPVRSTCYGIIEIKGWNRYGGWRIGIRDLNGVYHYYAHLSGYEKDLHEGQIMKPGDVIGWVGSSGYGKPGTQGKFPPHLHFGMYRDAGNTEWSFDPYPYLRKWEREDRKRK